MAAAGGARNLDWSAGLRHRHLPLYPTRPSGAQAYDDLARVDLTLHDLVKDRDVKLSPK